MNDELRLPKGRLNRREQTAVTINNNALFPFWLAIFVYVKALTFWDNRDFR